MYKLNPKQASILNALRAVKAAAIACEKDVAAATQLRTSHDSIKGVLVFDIGNTIVTNELLQEY